MYRQVTDNLIVDSHRPFVETLREGRRSIFNPDRVVGMAAWRLPSSDANFSANRFFCKPLRKPLNMEVF